MKYYYAFTRIVKTNILIYKIYSRLFSDNTLLLIKYLQR